MQHPKTSSGGRSGSSLWTEARIRRLVGLWNERLSAAGIARALGPPFTRSAVVGKLMRLGLRRTDEQRHEAQSLGARRSRRRNRPPSLPAIPLPPPASCPVTPRLVGIAELGILSCRWPYEIGEEIRFCGHFATRRPYCPAHRAIAYGATLPPLTLETLYAPERAGAGR
jgi:hypothetical protein